MATPAEIVRFDDAPPPAGEDPWVIAPTAEFEVVAADPGWPERFGYLSQLIVQAVGQRAILIEHVGSTAVPDLPAKPVIDIDLTVQDSSDESAWLPQLESAGFVLRVREPWWYEHRCLRLADPACNLHVFSPSCAEAERHRIFRDWLRTNPEDRARYADAKITAARQTHDSGGHSMDYNARKQALIREIYGRAFKSLGLIA